VRIRLLAFATAAQALGAAARDWELETGATVGDLGADLRQRVPALADLLPRLAIAVDGELARADRVLAEDCEVALLPPVSGG
jgi:molybdopterin converting factor small subunit